MEQRFRKMVAMRQRWRQKQQRNNFKREVKSRINKHIIPVGLTNLCIMSSAKINFLKTLILTLKRTYYTDYKDQSVNIVEDEKL